MKSILKKYLFIITIIIVLAIQGGLAYAAEKDFTITENGTLSKYTGSDTVVTVPNTVKVIGSSAFSDCTSIEEIIIPEGVTIIEGGAFNGCLNLKKILFPSTLTTIEECIFDHCKSLKEVTIPKSVTTWEMSDGEGYYENGIESYIIDPENARFSSIDGIVYNKDGTIPLYYPCNKKNETYTLPDSVTDITQINLRTIKYLKHIIFNDKVTIDFDTYGLNFNHFLNGSLESFTVSKNNETFCDIDGVLFTKDKKTLLAYPENKPGELYRIPEGTERIFTEAFCNYDEEAFKLKYILFPSSIKDIRGCVAWNFYYDDSKPNNRLVLFGIKGSVVETYAKLNQIPFSSYAPLKKGAQLLLTASDLSLTAKETTKLTPVYLSTVTGQAITWKSSNSSIATVDQKGKISAKKLGVAVISATSKDGLQAVCKVTVRLSSPKVRIVSGTSSEIVFAWKKVPGAISYTLYRIGDEGGFYFRKLSGDLSALQDPITKLGTTTKLTFAEKNPLNVSNDYIVIANHAKSQYNSKFSLPVYVYMPTKAKKVALTQCDNGIKISWKIESFPDRLTIYRSTSKNGNYEIIRDTEECYDSFTDSNVKPDTTYFYKIQVYSINDGIKIYSGYTEPVGIKVK